MERPEPTAVPSSFGAKAKAGRLKPVLHARGDQPDNTRMERGARQHQRRGRLTPKADLGLRGGNRFLHHQLFRSLPLGVELFKFRGDALRLRRVFGQQQAAAERGVAMRPPALMRGPSRKPR